MTSKPICSTCGIELQDPKSWDSIEQDDWVLAFITWNHKMAHICRRCKSAML